MDIFPTVARLAGVPVPPHLWKDKAGKPMVFDGVDQSDLFLGKGPSKRDNFIYFEDQDFGGVRLGHYKMLFTQRDTWLGPRKDKNVPALYNLQWDPGEKHDLFFSADAGDRMWKIVYMGDQVTNKFLKEVNAYPNRAPAGAGGYVTKSSIELLMKKDMIADAFKKMLQEKAEQAK